MRNENCRGWKIFYVWILAGLLVSAYSDRETVRDIDGNVYGTVRIGDQVWMTENLRVTRYNDGTEIPLITDAVGWARASADGYCWYGNEASNAVPYGALYNWFAVETGKLCPPGWRVPSDEDWEILVSFLKKQGLGAGSLRTTEPSLWEGPNQKGVQSTGFSAVPGGYRFGQYWAPPDNFTGPLYYEMGLNGCFWSSTAATGTHAWSRTIHAYTETVLRSFFIKQTGYSVRAIKN